MTRRYEIGPFLLDADACVLTRAGIPTPLGARAVAVLRTLVERAHEHVPKAEIMDAAWPGIVVEESNLAVQISAVRRVLAQVPDAERWIETLSRRGYRFVGPASRLPDARSRRDRPGRAGLQLPRTTAAFVGRDRELVELKRLLPRTRLLTLVGAGGIGKTRLAVQVAAEVVDAYPDGVGLIEFGSLSDPALVPPTVAQALGVEERARRPLLETLRADLGARRLLLIFDNCEHLLEACAGLADGILRGTSGPTIVATSREPLQLAGEQIFPVSALSLPDPTASRERIAKAESVQLFMDRARRMQPDFALTVERAPVVANVCIHLDGIPLALELAAARIRSLSIEQINARLGDRFRLLTAGARESLPRQQTLRATLDWSYDLLPEAERIILRRLAVFPGSFTLEAACGVASDGSIDEFAVIDVIAQLVARSLVVADATDTGTRYRLLETTRAYAAEKLAEAGEVVGWKLRHAQYFRGAFEQAFEDWMRMPDREWQARHLPELDNVRAALDWALGADDAADVAIALAGSSGPLWSALSLWSEGIRWMDAAGARADTRTSDSALGRLRHWLGNLLQAEPERALVALEQATALYRRLDDRLKLAEALILTARPLARMGRLDESAALLAEALPMLEGSSPPRLRAFYFSNRAHLKKKNGDLPGARADDERALSLFREAGADWAELVMLGVAADSTWAAGDLDGALVHFLEYIAMVRESRANRRTSLGFALANLAGLRTERGELDEALAAAREAVPMLDNGGPAWIFTDHFALRLALAGNFPGAARLAGYADAAFSSRKATREPNEARAQERLRRLLRATLVREELERLAAEGAAMTEAEARQIALE